MKRVAASLAGFALVALLGAGIAPAQTARVTMARGDLEFLQNAAAAGHMVVESGKIALAKAVNTQVRGFAQQMIDDHTRVNSELATLALSKGVDLPGEPSLAQTAKIKLLAARDGAGFDRRYADTFGVGAHRDALHLFQKAATAAADPDIKAFAAKALPTLEHHFDMAREMKSVVDKEGNAKAPSDRKQ